MSELDLGPIKKLLEDFTWEDFAPMVAHQYLIDCVAEVGRLRSDRASVRREGYENGITDAASFVRVSPGYFVGGGERERLAVDIVHVFLGQREAADQGQGGERS